MLAELVAAVEGVVLLPIHPCETVVGAVQVTGQPLEQ